MRRSRSGACAIGSTIWRRATGWRCIEPNIGLRFELAAIAKRLDGRRATLFPRPDGHPIPVVSGLISDRGWMAEAMAVEAGEVVRRFQEAALQPLPWRETALGARAGNHPPPGGSGAPVAASHPQRARRRPLRLGRPDDHPQSAHRKAERIDPPLPIDRTEPAGRAAAAAPRPHVLRDGGAGRARRWRPRSWSASIR